MREGIGDFDFFFSALRIKENGNPHLGRGRKVKSELLQTETCLSSQRKGGGREKRRGAHITSSGTERTHVLYHERGGGGEGML